MPNELSEQVQVEFTPEFKRNLRALSKKYRHIRSDVQPIIDQLQAGEVIGDQVPRTTYTIFKVRVRNCDIQKPEPNKRAVWERGYPLPITHSSRSSVYNHSVGVSKYRNLKIPYI
jgi:mRNA-degrading endonuclease RelE of RelBE toxin-antitoxin system